MGKFHAIWLLLGLAFQDACFLRLVSVQTAHQHILFLPGMMANNLRQGRSEPSRPIPVQFLIASPTFAG